MEQPISLEQFQEMALKVKYFKCNECGKSFSQLEDIVSHLETHKKKKVKENFICHECSAVLDSIDALMKHLETHEKTGNRSTSKTTELVPIIPDPLQNNSSLVNGINTTGKATLPSEKTTKQNKTKTGKTTAIMKQSIEPSSSDVFKSEPKYLKVKECFICQECSAMFESTELLTNHEKEQHKKTENAQPFRATEQIPIIIHNSPSEAKSVSKVLTLQESETQLKIPKNSVETKQNGQQSNAVTPKSETKQKPNRTVHQCPHCPKNFLSKGILAIHTKRSHASEASLKKEATSAENNKNYSCCECSERFSTIEELVLHLQSHVKNKSATPLPNCNRTQREPNENLMKVSGKKKKKGKVRRSTVYPCEFCSGVFGYADDLEKHLKVHSEGTLDSSSALMENVSNDNNDTGIPTNDNNNDSNDIRCSDKLPNEDSAMCVNDDPSIIDKSLIDEDANISFSYDDDKHCGSDGSLQIPSNISFALTEKDKLTSEIQPPVDTAIKENDPTSLLNGLADAHAEESRSQDLFELSVKDDSVTNSEYHFCECKFCNEKFSTVASFKAHLVQAHSNIPSKYGCSHCPFFSSTTAELETHMEEHKHTCQLCSHIFEGAREFIKHLRSHTARKPHKCKICLMAFASVDEYELHLPKCTKHKFVCRHCSADFSCRKTFVHHLFKHTGPEPYLCQTPCSKSFATLEKLNAHQISDCELHVISPEETVENTSSSSRPARQECPFCSATFAFFHNLKVHLRTHTGERPYVCEHCSEGFITSSQLTVHLRTHTGEKPFQCHHCSESFHYHSALANHLTNHNVEKTFQCEKCTKTFYSEDSLQNHMKKHEKEKKHECSICFKTFHQMRNLSAHIRVHTGERPFVCSFCDKAFVQKSHLTNHVRIHTQEKPYLCLICSKSFRTHSSLINHKSVHDKRDYICEICGRICKSVTALRFHQRLHKANKELKYQCEYCDQNFAYQFKLNVHLNAHTGNKPYKCPFCPKQFAFPSNLYTHKKRMHFMDRPHQCKECNKGFFTPRELSKHMVTHREGNSGSDFACNVCEKVFMTYSSLKLHSRKHSARNTFVCQYCPRTFSSSHNLLSHERSHTGERPFRCLKCPKAFSTSSILSKHMKKDHPEEDADADMKAVETITTKEEIPQENMLFTIGNIVTDSEGNQYPIEVTEAIVRQLESEIQFPTNVIFITEPTQ